MFKRGKTLSIHSTLLECVIEYLGTNKAYWAIKGYKMSYVIYGTDNSKRVIVANNIHEAYNSFVSGINNYFIKNYNYKIERLY